MSVTLTGSAVRNILTGQTAHTTGAIASVALHETLGYFFSDRSGGATVTGVTDDSAIGYTLRSTLTDGTFLTAYYVREDVAADASLAIIGTTSGSGNSQVIGARFASSLGGAAFPTFHAAATPNKGEPTDGVNDLVHTSNAVTVTAATSLIVCAVATSGAQTTLPTARVYLNGVDTAAATVTPAAGAGVRSFLVTYSASTPGAYHIVFTATATTTSNMHVVALTDEAAGPTITSVDADNSLALDDTSVAIVGTNFDNTVPKATAVLRQGGFDHALTASSQDATTFTTSLPDTVTSGGVGPKAGTASAVIINDDLQEGTRSVTLTNAAGTLSVDVVDPSTDPSEAIILVPPAQDGDQVRWRLTGGTFSESDFTLNPDLTYEMAEGLLDELVAETATLELQAWDFNDSTWGSWSEIDFTEPVAGGTSVYRMLLGVG